MENVATLLDFADRLKAITYHTDPADAKDLAEWVAGDGLNSLAWSLEAILNLAAHNVDPGTNLWNLQPKKYPRAAEVLRRWSLAEKLPTSGDVSFSYYVVGRHGDMPTSPEAIGELESNFKECKGTGCLRLFLEGFGDKELLERYDRQDALTKLLEVNPTTFEDPEPYFGSFLAGAGFTTNSLSTLSLAQRQLLQAGFPSSTSAQDAFLAGLNYGS